MVTSGNLWSHLATLQLYSTGPLWHQLVTNCRIKWKTSQKKKPHYYLKDSLLSEHIACVPVFSNAGIRSIIVPIKCSHRCGGLKGFQFAITISQQQKLALKWKKKLAPRSWVSYLTKNGLIWRSMWTVLTWTSKNWYKDKLTFWNWNLY